jgi:hypothetical protein
MSINTDKYKIVPHAAVLLVQKILEKTEPLADTNVIYLEHVSRQQQNTSKTFVYDSRSTIEYLYGVGIIHEIHRIKNDGRTIDDWKYKVDFYRSKATDFLQNLPLDENIYEITYDDHMREIKINGNLLTKTHFGSDSDMLFEYVYNHSGLLLEKVSIEKATEQKMRTLAAIVKDLKFVDVYREVFFPVVTKTQIKFVNPITRRYALENHLPTLPL